MKHTWSSFFWQTCEALDTFSSPFPTGAAIWHIQLTPLCVHLSSVNPMEEHARSDMQDELNA